MANFQFLVPIEATNFDKNPGAEADGNYSAYNSATVSRSTTYARVIGPESSYSFRVQTAGTNRGITKTTGTLANAASWVNFWVKGTYTGANLRVRINSTDHTPSLVETASDSWALYRAAITAGNSSGQTSYTVYHTTSGADFYLDDMCIQQVAETVLPFHGAYNGGQGFVWNGIAHQSTSTMYARLPNGKPNLYGGATYDFDDGTYLVVSSMLGLGLPPLEHQVQQGLEAGATYQSTSLQPRVMTLIALLKTNTTTANFQALHARRDILNDYIQPGQPFVFRYHGTGYPQEIECVYSKGLEGAFQAPPFVERLSITLTAYQPFFRNLTEAATALSMASAPTIAYALMKSNDSGWAVPGGGTGNTSRAIAVSKRNIVAVGRDTSGAVMLYDGASWTSVGSVTGGSAVVTWLAWSPSGETLYIGGSFTAFDGTSCNNIISYTLPSTGVSGGTKTVLGSGTNGVDSTVRGGAVLSNGDLIVVGDFVNAGGSSANYIAKWSASGNSWSSLGSNSVTSTSTSAANGRLHCATVNGADEVLIGGDFDAIGTLSTPSAPTVSNTTGSLSSGNWGYRITALTGSPTAPTGETAASSTGASGTSSTGKSLSWSAVTGATGYKVYRESSAGGGPSVIFYLTTVTTNSFTDIGQFTLDTNTEDPSTATDGGRSNCVAIWMNAYSSYRSAGTSGMGNGIVRAVAWDRDGVRAYAGGSFDSADGVSARGVAGFNGQVWSGLGTGLNSSGQCYAIAPDPLTGKVWFGGDFLSVNGSTLAANVATWTPGLAGSGIWQHEDVTFTGSTTVRGIAFDIHKQLWLVTNTSGAGSVSAQTTVTAYNAGGVMTYPRVYITGPGTFRGLDNDTSRQSLRFNLTVATDEIVTLDFRPGYKSIYSTRQNGAVRLNTLMSGPLGQWGLLPGANRIRVHYTGTSGNASVKLVDPQLKMSGDS